MNGTQGNTRLSQITTLWSVVRQAHQGREDENATARRQLLDRYSSAVYRYLLGALRDADAADELFQEFALRFIRGDFHRADPEQGRFRSFVKSSLFYMIVQYRKRQNARPLPLDSEGWEGPGQDQEAFHSDEEFLRAWREKLLANAWSGLLRIQQVSEQPYHDVLRFRADHPTMRSPEMAAQLSVTLGKRVTAAGVRQTLHRAREKFAELLLEEVVQSLEDPTPERVEDELTDLGLLRYCRPALERR